MVKKNELVNMTLVMCTLTNFVDHNVAKMLQRNSMKNFYDETSSQIK